MKKTMTNDIMENGRIMIFKARRRMQNHVVCQVKGDVNIMISLVGLSIL